MLDITVSCPHCSGMNEVNADAGQNGDYEYTDFTCNECEEEYYIVVNYNVRKH